MKDISCLELVVRVFSEEPISINKWSHRLKCRIQWLQTLFITHTKLLVWRICVQTMNMCMYLRRMYYKKYELLLGFFTVTPTAMRPINWPVTYHCIHQNHNNAWDNGDHKTTMVRQITTKASNGGIVINNHSIPVLCKQVLAVGNKFRTQKDTFSFNCDESTFTSISFQARHQISLAGRQWKAEEGRLSFFTINKNIWMTQQILRLIVRNLFTQFVH